MVIRIALTAHKLTERLLSKIKNQGVLFRFNASILNNSMKTRGIFLQHFFCISLMN